MPIMSKIRITNAQLENGLKAFGNKIWDLRENNTLFLLENGGGKTSVIQMLQQVVTPNSTVQGRKIHKTLKKGSIAHIAVEWEPDDSERNHFITGFTLNNHGKKQKDKDVDYDYLTYIYEIDNDENYQLEDLPFLDEGKVTSLYELEKILISTPGVNTFQNKVRDYTAVLESYGIFQNEWANIAKINSDEGGIQGFFDNAKTVSTLISRLFIPSLEKNLYDVDSQDNIIHAFNDRKKELLEIPQMEKYIQDFEILENQGENIIQASEEFKETQREYMTIKNQLGRFHKTIHNETNRMEQKRRESEQEKKVCQSEKDELEYALASYPIYKEEDKKQDQEEKLERVNEQLEQIEREIAFYENKMNEENMMKHFGRYQRKKEQLTREETRYNLMDLTEDEKTKEFNKARGIVSEGNSFLRRQEEKRENDGWSNLDKLRQKIKRKKEDLKVERRTLQSNVSRHSQLNNILETHQKDKQQLIQATGAEWKGKMEDTLASLEQKQTKTKGKLALLDDKTTEIERQRMACSNDIIQAKTENKNNQSEIDRVSDGIQVFYAEKDKLLEVMPVALNTDVRGKLFQLQGQVEHKLQLMLRKNEEKLFELNVEQRTLETDLEIIHNDGFYVHPELRRVKEELYMKGVDLVLGIEHLLNLDVKKAEKERVVQINPLISFSLIVEENEIAKIKQVVSRIKHNISIPIFFLKKSALSNLEHKESFFALNDDYYVFRKLETMLTEEDWRNLGDELNQHLIAIQEQKEELQKERHRFITIQKRVVDFFERYGEKSEDGLLRQRTQLEKCIADNFAIIRGREDKLNDLQTEANKVKREKDHTNQEWNTVEQLIKMIKAFIDNYQNIKRDKEEKEKLDMEINQMQDKIDNDEDSLDLEANKLNNLMIQVEQIKESRKKLKQEQIDFQLEDIINADHTNKSTYVKNLEILRQRKQEISAEEDRKREIEERILTLKEELNEVHEEIKILGYSLEFAEKNYRGFDQRLLEEYELHRDIYREDLEKAKGKRERIKSGIFSAEKMIQFHLEQIKDTFDQDEPFLYGSDLEIEYDYYKKQLGRTKEKMNKLQEEISQIDFILQRYALALDDIELIADQFTHKDDVDELELSEWNQKNPTKTFRALESQWKESHSLLGTKERKIESEIESLMQEVKKTKNSTLITMSRKLKPFLEENRMEYDKLIEHFVRMLDTIEDYKESLIIKKEDALRSEEEIVDMMRLRADTLYSSIKEIEKNSIVEFKGERKPTVKIKWVREPDAQATYNFEKYIGELVDTIIEMENKGVPGKEIDNYTKKELRMEKILNCYALMDKCDLRVWKPRNDILSGYVTYEHWDQAAAWSGGETSSFKMTMFISFNNLLRKKKTSRENTGKVIIVDNPFGKASSRHVIAPMVDLAKKTNTQLFCLTDIDNDDVLNSFETVISNKYVANFGRANLHSDVKYKKTEGNLESIAYSKELL